MATIKDVAKRAGVSAITVSRVINGADSVGERTRAKVEAAIAELHYVPNMVASNLRSQKSDAIALVLPDITNTFWTSIARGAEDEGWSHGYGVFICNTDDDFEKEDGYIERLIRRRVEGILLVPASRNDSRSQIDRLKKHGVKFVIVHKKPIGVVANVVRTDGEKAAYVLTTKLLETGSRRIAFVGLPFVDPPSEYRFHGYLRALRENNIQHDPTLVRLGESRKGAGGFRMVSELLEDANRPDGILIANSSLAVGGIQAITVKGLNIPNDLHVAAFHDNSALDNHAPHLITAIQPAYEMGKLAARRLLTMTAAENEPVEETILDIDIRVPQGFTRPQPT